MQVLNQNLNISAPNEKNKFLFWSVFLTFFLRLQIYEVIAAIFWQRASYVCNLMTKRILKFHATMVIFDEGRKMSVFV